MKNRVFFETTIRSYSDAPMTPEQLDSFRVQWMNGMEFLVGLRKWLKIASAVSFLIFAIGVAALFLGNVSSEQYAFAEQALILLSVISAFVLLGIWGFETEIILMRYPMALIVDGRDLVRSAFLYTCSVEVLFSPAAVDAPSTDDSSSGRLVRLVRAQGREMVGFEKIIFEDLVQKEMQGVALGS